MNDKQKDRVKKFGDKLAEDRDVLAHVVTVWYSNGDVENNWSGVQTNRQLPTLVVDDPDE
jgi:hypothetical protein